MVQRNPYEVLGVRCDASAVAIHDAYRRLAKRWDPDANPGDPVAEALFKEIAGAYEILSDEQRRAAVDGALDGGLNQPAPNSADGAFTSTAHRAANDRGLRRADDLPSTALIVLIANAFLLVLIVVFACVIPQFFRVVSLRLFIVMVAALIFAIFKFGMDWVEERAWRHN
jgi:hypothetical protein